MTEWLENHQLPCVYKTFLGFECPTCGMQRAFILLLQGEIWESVKMYPALLPTFVLVILLLAWAVFRKPSWLFIKRFIQLDLGIVFISWLIRLLYLNA